MNEAIKLEKKIEDAIMATYPKDVWPDVPDELKAKDAVAATLLRRMAPALARIAVETLKEELNIYD
jgi:hypothetical protein